MKIHLLLIGLLCLSSVSLASPVPSRRINGLLRFIANQEGLRDLALYTLISRRCNRYLPWDRQGACRDAVKKQIDLLDYDIIFTHPGLIPPKDTWSPDAFVFIAFKKTLIETLSDPKTTTYLEMLKKGLNDVLLGTNPGFNIWDASVTFYKTPLAAAKVISALFQDTSLVKLHLAYLEKSRIRGRHSFDSNKESLSRIIDTINQILDYSEDHYRGLFYPHPLREKLTRNIYHFYVPLYLAMALKHKGVREENALAAPMLLNLTYEFVTMAPDYRYLVNDPYSLDPDTNRGTIKDIFTGSCGTTFGLGRMVPANYFSLLQSAFKASTATGVDLILHSAY